MPLATGTTLGPYQIVAQLGAGGMGEVYRARDTRLKREVALKILPQAFALDPDRLSRFTREAHLLASLNHHHIAAIYGFEVIAGVQALAMELVEGPTLADRLSKGPIAIEDALAFARQIAEALEAAHEQGIVHRDLKPANIKLRPDGTVKVLDFGLAKALEPAAAVDVDASKSPTITSPAIGVTGVGTILGTAAYMAPEQAKGRPADKRSDIWAYGIVLVEMLTGKPVYAGDTISEVLAAVIMQDPDLKSLPRALPAPVRRLIGRCLQKDPKQRMRDIGEARLALDEKPGDREDEPLQAMPAVRHPSSRRHLAVTTVLAAALAASLALTWRNHTTIAPLVTRYDVMTPAALTINLADQPAIALSTDRSTVAFVVVGAGGTNRLFLRRRDEAEPEAVPGSDGASSPAFSPDGRSLAFFAENALKRYADGTITSIAKVESANNTRGVTWIGDGTLVYSPGNATGLVRIPAGGGSPEVISRVDQTRGERTHRWPQALPGGKAVLFTVGTQASPDDYDGASIEALLLATRERRVVVKGARMASYAATGHLIFARGGSLYAASFDVNALALRGPAQLVVQGVAGDRTTGAAHFSVADDGTLAYVPGAVTTANLRLVWADRRGNLQPLDLPAGNYGEPQVSPDGTKLALTVTAGDAKDVWIHNISTKTFTRLTFGGQNWTPAWTDNSKDILYVSSGDGPGTDLLRKPADGSAEAQRLAHIDGRAYLSDLRGNTVILDRREVKRDLLSDRFDLATLDLKTPANVKPLVSTPGGDVGGVVSPGGRFLAYSSDESGRPEVFVRDFPGPGGLWQISTAGGEEPHWSPDGGELFFRNNDLLMSAPVDTRAGFQASTPVPLFKGIYNTRNTTLQSYTVDPKSGRFLMIRPANDESDASRVHVVLNWFEELKQHVAAK